MTKTVSYKPYNFDLTIYLGSWFPFFGSGWSITLLNIAFVKYTKYANGDICWDITPEQDAQGYGSTHRTMLHEYSHLVLRKQIGFYHYSTWCFHDYVILWNIPHDKKPIEIAVEAIRKTLINPY